MKVPVVDQFCCGFTLRTGTLFIGIFWAIASFVVLVSYSVFAGNLLYYTGFNGGSMRGLAIFTAILSALELAVSCLLIYGTLQTKAALMMPWILVCGILTLINVVCYLALAIVFFVSFQVLSGISVLISGVFSLVLIGYFLVVVHSYYLTIQVTPAPNIHQYNA